MAEQAYTNSIADDFPGGAVNAEKYDAEIRDSAIVTALDRIVIDPDDDDPDRIDTVFKAALSTGDRTIFDGDTSNPAGGLIAAHDNTASIPSEEVSLKGAFYEEDGRQRTNQTTRPLGTRLVYSVEGDDQADYSKVWGGDKMHIVHNIGDAATQTAYLDLNTIQNDTYLKAGLPIMGGADRDEVKVQSVPQVTSKSAGSNTVYSEYGGYLIVPAASPIGEGAGIGTLTVADGDRRLVQILPDEQGNVAQGWWDATWNPTTKVFDSITANLTGTGGFNMFSLEVVLSNFAPLLIVSGAASGISALESEESDQLPHGVRVKLTIITIGTDHDWHFGLNFEIYRAKLT